MFRMQVVHAAAVAIVVLGAVTVQPASAQNAVLQYAEAGPPFTVSTANFRVLFLADVGVGTLSLKPGTPGDADLGIFSLFSVVLANDSAPEETSFTFMRNLIINLQPVGADRTFSYALQASYTGTAVLSYDYFAKERVVATYTVSAQPTSYVLGSYGRLNVGAFSGSGSGYPDGLGQMPLTITRPFTYVAPAPEPSPGEGLCVGTLGLLGLGLLTARKARKHLNPDMTPP